MKVRARPLMSLIASVVVVAAVALVHAVPAVADSKPTNSAKLAEPLKKAQEEITNKHYPEAITKLKDAESIAGKTPYDQHLINEMLTFSYIKTQNYTEAAKTMEAELDDGFVPAGEMNQKIKALAELNYQIKNYDKAIDFGNRAIKGGFADESMKTLVGQSYYLKGDWKGTLKYEEGIVDAQIKAGEKPTNESLRIIFSACQKVNDDACGMRAMEKLVTYYPSTENWGNLLFTIRKDASSNEGDLLQTYRLMSEVDVLKDPTDYSEMAELALDNGSPGEAQSTLEKAIAKGVFTDQRVKDRSQRMLEGAKKRATADQATLPKLEGEANSAATGEKNVAIGAAYLGYGQYDKAVDQLSKGLSKGGLKNETQARLLLGIAQFKSGHKDDALKTFHDVKGDPALERLASLWAIHTKQA